MGSEVRVLRENRRCAGCCPFLLMVYSGSPVETSVGHGLHQQLLSRYSLLF